MREKVSACPARSSSVGYPESALGNQVMSELQIRRYQAGDETAIRALFKLAFGRAMSEPFWRWRFEENPAGSGEIILAWDGHTLAGHYAAVPVELSVRGQSLRALLSMTTMTHPGYTGRGIFTTLASNLYEQAVDDYELVFGFPNGNSRNAFAKKLGWTDLGLMEALHGPVVINGDSRFESTAVEGLSGEAASYVERDPIPSSVYTKRTEAYLRWRYFDHPEETYRVIEVHRREGAIAGIAVVKVYGAVGGQVGHILEFFCDPIPKLKRLWLTVP